MSLTSGVNDGLKEQLWNDRLWKDTEPELHNASNGVDVRVLIDERLTCTAIVNDTNKTLSQDHRPLFKASLSAVTSVVAPATR